MNTFTTPTLAEGETHVATIAIPGQAAYHLILLPGDIEATFEDAEGWAEGGGGVLPNRHEQALLFAHQRDQFQRDWYWSSQQHESDPDYVWCQYFGYGNQLDDYRYDKLRARAVRRLPI